VDDSGMVTIAGLEGKTILQGDLDRLKEAWQTTLRDL
jgi:hypothetical protein